MLDSRRGRLASLGVLFVVLWVVCIGFGAATAVTVAPDLPYTGHVVFDSDRYVGQSVQVSGTVLSTDPVVIAAEYDYYANGQRHAGVDRFTIRGVAHSVTPGDTLQVYGTLTSSEVVTAQNVVIVPSQNYWYMYGVSGLAGVWVFGRILAGWRFDFRSFSLSRRDALQSLWSLLSFGGDRGES